MSSEFVITPTLVVNIFRSSAHIQSGQSAPLWAVREFDMKVLRVRYPKQRSRAGPNEQAIRAAIRQAMLNLKLRIEQASKGEIRILKDQGVLGKRAPSCTLLNSFDIIKLLKAFGKKKICLKFIAAVSAAFPHLAIALENEFQIPIPAHHRAMLEADFGSSDEDGEEGNGEMDQQRREAKERKALARAAALAARSRTIPAARMNVPSGLEDLQDEDEEDDDYDVLHDIDYSKKMRALACRRRMMSIYAPTPTTDSNSSSPTVNSTPSPTPLEQLSQTLINEVAEDEEEQEDDDADDSDSVSDEVSPPVPVPSDPDSDNDLEFIELTRAPRFVEKKLHVTAFKPQRREAAENHQREVSQAEREWAAKLERTKAEAMALMQQRQQELVQQQQAMLQQQQLQQQQQQQQLFMSTNATFHRSNVPTLLSTPSLPSSNSFLPFSSSSHPPSITLTSPSSPAQYKIQQELALQQQAYEQMQLQRLQQQQLYQQELLIKQQHARQAAVVQPQVGQAFPPLVPPAAVNNAIVRAPKPKKNPTLQTLFSVAKAQESEDDAAIAAAATATGVVATSPPAIISTASSGRPQRLRVPSRRHLSFGIEDGGYSILDDGADDDAEEDEEYLEESSGNNRSTKKRKSNVVLDKKAPGSGGSQKRSKKPATTESAEPVIVDTIVPIAAAPEIETVQAASHIVVDTCDMAPPLNENIDTSSASTPMPTLVARTPSPDTPSSKESRHLVESSPSSQDEPSIHALLQQHGRHSSSGSLSQVSSPSNSIASPPSQFQRSLSAQDGRSSTASTPYLATPTAQLSSSFTPSPDHHLSHTPILMNRPGSVASTIDYDPILTQSADVKDKLEANQPSFADAHSMVIDA